MAEPDSSRLQLVDGDGNFVDTEVLARTIKNWKFGSKGFNYFVVAILGCQSSGKSTLLNHLFGTTFQVLPPGSVPTQTTKGVWMSRSIYSGDVDTLVLDVEGTDSSQRYGEEAESFERKISLLSLALSEILIINMWYQDIGRYNASNYGLLKTVFELNLQLFTKEKAPKTLLLFVIRDHVQQLVPLSRLRELITKDMKDIWDGLIKPPAFASSQMTDFFDFEFTSLPHKIVTPEEFIADATKLRERFHDANHPQYLLQTRYKKDIPADGFPSYAQSIWETVKANRDLDLPTQKEMLAMYRCEAISEEILARFLVSVVAPARADLARSVPIDGFGEKMSAHVRAALAEYDDPASRYHRETALKKREALLGKLADALQGLYAAQITLVASQLYNLWEAALQCELDTGAAEAAAANRSAAAAAAQSATAAPNAKYAVRHFAKLASRMREQILKDFEAAAAAARIHVDTTPPPSPIGMPSSSEPAAAPTPAPSPFASWTADVEAEELRRRVDKRLAAERATQLGLLLEETKRGLKTKLWAQLNRPLDDAAEDMWDKVRRIYNEARTAALCTLEDRLRDEFEMQGEETAKYVSEMGEAAFALLKGKLQEKVEHLPYRLDKRFQDAFRLDAQGLPRKWLPGVDIPGLFKAARKTAEGLIDKFALVRLNPELDSLVYFSPVEGAEVPEVDEALVVIPIDRCQQLRERFLKDSEASYLAAVREQENASQSHSISYYYVLLILILGFNEFWMVLTNPILLVLVVFLGGGAYVAYLLNLGGPLWTLFDQILGVVIRSLQQTVRKLASRQGDKEHAD